MHIFRRIWQDFGPFPLIGCDSEGLVWHFNYEKNIQYKRDELISTSGFVITADQGNLLKDIGYLQNRKLEGRDLEGYTLFVFICSLLRNTF